MSEQSIGTKLYNIHFENRQHFLFVQVGGDSDSLEVSLQFWAEILQQLRSTGYTKVLVVESFKNAISTFDTYILKQQLGQMGFFNIRIAFVDEEPAHLELNQFGETVATNRGLILKVFPDIREAEIWLLER